MADETLADLDTTLSENGISLCALQEVRRDGFRSVNTNNYTIYWFGECSGHRGVGFAVHRSFVHLLKDVHPIPGSDGRLMTIELFLLDSNNPTTFICAYSPPNSSTTRKREKFYSQLRRIVKPSSWLMGNLNARVGRSTSEADSEFGAERSNTIRPWSLKGDIVPNANGSLLIDVAGENDYRHLSLHFAIRDSKRWTWKHPRYNTLAD